MGKQPVLQADGVRSGLSPRRFTITRYRVPDGICQFQGLSGSFYIVHTHDVHSIHCGGCHGTTGNNGWAPSLNNDDFLAAVTDGFLQATIAVGRTSTPMRPYGRGADGVAELSGDQINDIVACIRTWAPQGHRPAGVSTTAINNESSLTAVQTTSSNNP